MDLRADRLGAVLAGAALIVSLISCSGGNGRSAPPATGARPGAGETDRTPSGTADATATPPRTTVEPSPTRAAAGSRSPGPGEFTNPVYAEPLADPFILPVDGTYYAYGTKGFEATDFATVRSSDLVHWEELPTALPELPRWSTGRTWAPEVAAIGDGYVMYFSTNVPDTPSPNGQPSQCIAVAVADDPAGPFTVESERPLVCQPELGGSIDATYFRDGDGTAYLIWKNDGNCCGIPTQFFQGRLTEDGLGLVGRPIDLGLSNDRPWEGAVIEAPTMYEHDGTYYLFYSGGHFGGQFYSVGYATSDSVGGPFDDAEENPILKTRAPAAGPGHQTIVIDKDGDLWMAYHAWDIDRIGEQFGGARKMWLDELTFEDGKPVVLGPDAGPQPIP